MSDGFAHADVVTGFYGKIVCRGDFLSRRLPQSFVSTWDTWLQTGIQGSRVQLDTRWLDTYMSSPIWRFALAPGVCDDDTWVGILMPSIDSVGRHFPLTIAAGLAGPVPLLDWIAGSADWYAELEVLALSTLREDSVFEQFDAALQTITVPPVHALSAPVNQASALVAHVCLPLASLEALPQALPGLARTVANAALAGHGLWWTDGSAEVAPSLHVWRGLPAVAAFSAMLDGDWGVA